MPTQQQLVVQHYSVRGPLTPVPRCPVSCCQVSRFQRPRSRLSHVALSHRPHGASGLVTVKSAVPRAVALPIPTSLWRQTDGQKHRLKPPALGAVWEWSD